MNDFTLYPAAMWMLTVASLSLSLTAALIPLVASLGAPTTVQEA